METKQELIPFEKWNKENRVDLLFYEIYGIELKDWRDLVVAQGNGWSGIPAGYEVYKKWHYENYTKLGRALK